MMKRGSGKLVATHSGTFHCDEALGVALLRKLPEFVNMSLIRTRDEELLKSADLVLDVGGVYDAARCRFDHHQNGFAEVFGNGFTTKLSSAGLIYKHYGLSIVSDAMRQWNFTVDSNVAQTGFRLANVCVFCCRMPPLTNQ